MTYSQKVKQSKKVLEAIRSLKDDESITVTYGKNSTGEPKEYKIRAYNSYKDEISYSIWSSYQGMNIDKIGKTTMKAYTYDMMSQRTTYVFPLYKLNVIK